MAERERKLAGPRGGTFIPRTQVLSPEDVSRALVRIAHEIIERNRGADDLVVVGLQTGGAEPARRIASVLEESEGSSVPVGTLDVAFYRDDLSLRPVVPQAATDIPCDLTGKVVILVDDVIFTGRTVRAAMAALADHGRARLVQLAVVVDRGHREVPVRPDYVGKNLPTRLTEQVDVSLDGVVIGDVVRR